MDASDNVDDAETERVDGESCVCACDGWSSMVAKADMSDSDDEEETDEMDR